MSPLVRPPSREPTAILHCSFKVYANEENKSLLKDLRIMAAKDGISFSEIIRVALGEYHQNHRPGNPQLVLGHWSENLPLPRSSKPYWKSAEELSIDRGWARGLIMDAAETASHLKHLLDHHSNSKPDTQSI